MARPTVTQSKLKPESVPSSWGIAQPFIPTEDFLSVDRIPQYDTPSKKPP
jgi:hypothetical protein